MPKAVTKDVPLPDPATTGFSPRKMLPLAPEENYQEIFMLRVWVNNKIREWHGQTKVTTLLGYTNHENLKPEQIRILRMLVGPHGHAIYKALVAVYGTK